MSIFHVISTICLAKCCLTCHPAIFLVTFFVRFSLCYILLCPWHLVHCPLVCVVLCLWHFVLLHWTPTHCWHIWYQCWNNMTIRKTFKGPMNQIVSELDNILNQSFRMDLWYNYHPVFLTSKFFIGSKRYVPENHLFQFSTHGF